ncbi:MAG: ytrA 2 [Verrucomicrobiales bacterium]|jgi:GntR family transcriptional regulator|nr:ytrA 2 [Verrucomicrobiales bacterium]
MYIRIEKGASAPITRQIAEQIRAQCLSGVLKEGDCLPSVRQLARELAVNVNTVLRVYERLAADGWIVMRHGEGTFVLSPSPDCKTVGELNLEHEQLVREFSSIVRRGLLLGISAPELRGMFSSALSQAKDHISKDNKGN